MFVQEFLQAAAQKPLFVRDLVSIVGDDVLELRRKVLHHCEEDLILLGVGSIVDGHQVELFHLVPPDVVKFLPQDGFELKEHVLLQSDELSHKSRDALARVGDGGEVALAQGQFLTL